VFPVATHSPDFEHASFLIVNGPGGPDVTCQLVPSQRSTRLLLPTSPTAMHEFGETQSTSVKKFKPPNFGVEASVHT
jgi:hypothetical protein